MTDHAARRSADCAGRRFCRGAAFQERMPVPGIAASRGHGPNPLLAAEWLAAGFCAIIREDDFYYRGKDGEVIR
jgi:hypothetical protein